MGYALLLLGLLPMMFMVDFSPGMDDAADTDADDDPANAPAPYGDGDFLAPTPDDSNVTSDDSRVASDDTLIAGLAPDDVPLAPVTGDETPVDGDPVDPDDVLVPVEGDETPVEGDPVDPETVLDPVDEPGEDAPPAVDASLLQSLLASETDFDTGSGWLGDYGPETSDTVLTGDEDHAASDDGSAGTGAGHLSDHDGTPVVTGDEPVAVIAGGDGANSITLGNDSAYAFGGDGDDTITGGDGAAALFGGAGADTLTGSDTAQEIWIDGGTGDDQITGGDGSDTLYGGAHGAGGAAGPDDDTIFGGGGDDAIAGGFGADTLSGGDGDDVVDHLGRAEQEISAPHHEFAWHIDNAADTLDGGDGNDTMIMDRADSATGGAGYDTFWIYSDGAPGSGAADIGDFTQGQDFLRITLNPDLDHGDMALSVAPSDDGQDGVVSVNGEAVAILRGVPGATEADMLVEVTENIFV